MMTNPPPGRIVQARYNEDDRPERPFHGRYGVVLKPFKRTRQCHGPRNHLVLIDDQRVIIPAGNLYPVKTILNNDGTRMEADTKK